MSNPNVFSVVNNALSVTIVFDEDVSYTAAVETGFTVTSDGNPRPILAAAELATGDGAILTIDPVYAGSIIAVTFDNTTTPYVFDAATGVDPAVGFMQISTNGSTITDDADAVTDIYTPIPTNIGGIMTGKVEVELCRADRALVRDFGPYTVDTTYTWEGDLTIELSGTPAEIKDGSVVSASITLDTQTVGSAAEAASAMSAWQARVRDNIITEVIKRREMRTSMGAATVGIYGV